MGIDAITQMEKRARWLRLGQRLFGERSLLLAGRLFYRLRVEGVEYIPASGACLFAFNHVAQPVDLMTNVLIRRHRPDIYLFGLHGFQGENPLAQFLALMGQQEAEEQVLRAYKARGLSAGELLRALRLLQAGAALALAAEGEFTWDGRLQHPLAPGAAWLGLRSGAPIVPVVSSGGYDVQPRWWLERMRLTGRVTIRVGPPLILSERPVQRLDDAEMEAANQRLWEAMAALLAGPSSLVSTGRKR
ncbi:MAG: 1-acyl-sn-glycerol-3-phosphate acyltransferase [Anaerolineae bacterium]|nr:1-acyl-sn-glycerol-3-phosphate acyltransferase [Anaerolineae bacterium]